MPFLSAWKIDRPEAALDLAERFSDKELIVAICNHLDKQVETASSEALRRGQAHGHLMAVLQRLPSELQMGDYALQVSPPTTCARTCRTLCVVFYLRASCRTHNAAFLWYTLTLED